MIHKPTVLILGAGASVPYGFPSGRSLLVEISSALRSPDSTLAQILLPYLNVKFEPLKSFGTALAFSMQPSVDAFLENRPEFLKVGKAAIAAALIPYEKEKDLYYSDAKSRWYQYLFNRLGANKGEFSKNRLSIVTFNYDRSLEQFLIIALQHSYGLATEAAFDMLEQIPIIHVYGQLGQLRACADGRAYSPEVSPEALEKSIAGIRILHEGGAASKEFGKANAVISNAEVVCFLGFGYHPTNVERLGINEIKRHPVRYLGSAYNLGLDEQRRVQNLFKPEIRLGLSVVDCLTFLRDYPVFDEM
jgi:hypothetical protein